MAPRRMSHIERLQACLGAGSLDRPPVALWRHFPVDDQSPEGLAAAALFFQRTYDFDLVKVTPSSSFCLKDWGVEDEWRGDPEGTRNYTRAAIRQPEDWEHLPVVDPSRGFLARQLASLRILVNELGPEVPAIQTIFSPLAQAKNLVGSGNLGVHLRRYPDALHAGLKTITESTRLFIEAARKTGIAGIFFAVQHAQFSLFSADEYKAFGRNYDLQVLEAAQGLWLNMLHLHGEDVMFSQVADYPVSVMNWHDRDTAPSLSEALARFPGAVCGGLSRIRTMVLGTPEQVTAEARSAIEATKGQRFILGTG
ncbi:MAG: uroporphyrinogen decarboxylase family protein, partial [Omnitrophica WOR_2 bacterium]